MKKPSTLIIGIMESLPEDPAHRGTFRISTAERLQVIALCKAVDKRDQQLRKGYITPALATKKPAKRKPANKKARR